MGNPELIQHLPQHLQAVHHYAPHVVHHAKHVVQACHKASPVIIKQGITVLHDIVNVALSVIITLPLGFFAGWYTKGRGLTGVKTDIVNAETAVKSV